MTVQYCIVCILVRYNTSPAYWHTFSAIQKHASLRSEAPCQDSLLADHGDPNLVCFVINDPSQCLHMSLPVWTEVLTVLPPSLVPSLDWVSWLWHVCRSSTGRLPLGKTGPHSFYLKHCQTHHKTVYSGTFAWWNKLFCFIISTVYILKGRELNLWICKYVLLL